MAKKKSAHTQWTEAQGRLKAARSDAGISEALEQLNEREAFIASAEKLEANEREIVFSIPDLAMRRRVIQANRECYSKYLAYEKEEAEEMRKRVRDAPGRIRGSNLWSSVIGAAVLVLVADWLGGITWALVATAAGVLFGVGGMLDAERRAKEEFNVANATLREQERYLCELIEGRGEGGYSALEEKTGQPDPARMI